jgi:hypothetical protein
MYDLQERRRQAQIGRIMNALEHVAEAQSDFSRGYWHGLYCGVAEEIEYYDGKGECLAMLESLCHAAMRWTNEASKPAA